jgi:hypothetical protein
MHPGDVDWPEMNVRLALREKRWGDAIFGAFLWGVVAVVIVPWGLWVGYRNLLRSNWEERALKFRRWLADKIDIEEERQMATALLKATGYRLGGATGNNILDPAGRRTGYQLGGASGNEILGPVGTQLVIVSPDISVNEAPPVIKEEEKLPRRREAVMATRAKRARDE